MPGLSIAGKTGHRLHRPAERRLRQRRTARKAYYASFVGFLPAEDPQVTILVSIDQPPADSGDRFGGTAAAPVFQQLAPTMIHELDIEPAARLDGLSRSERRTSRRGRPTRRPPHDARRPPARGAGRLARGRIAGDAGDDGDRR